MTRQTAKDFYEPQGGETVGYISALDAQNAIDTTYNDFESGDSAHVGSGDPHQQYQKESEKAAASGYASLDAGTKVPIAQIPTGSTASTVPLGNHDHDSDYLSPSEVLAGSNVTVDLATTPGSAIINSTSSDGHTIEDEGSPLTSRSKLNFVGAGVAVTDDAGDDASVVTIPETSLEPTVIVDGLPILADSSTTFESEATARARYGLSAWTGRRRWVSIDYAGHPAPTGMVAGDLWDERP